MGEKTITQLLAEPPEPGYEPVIRWLAEVFRVWDNGRNAAAVELRTEIAAVINRAVRVQSAGLAPMPPRQDRAEMARYIITWAQIVLDRMHRVENQGHLVLWEINQWLDAATV